MTDPKAARTGGASRRRLPVTAWTTVLLAALAPAARAQDAAGEAPMATTTAPPSGVWNLFLQSFDFFTVLLVLGSVAAGAYIFRCVIEIRGSAILPKSRVDTMRELVKAGRVGELRGYVEGDRSFPGCVMRAALRAPDNKDARREAAELAASEQVAAWFRRIEPLNVIGNLGPLIGLAGTVWGMVIAFSTLGQAGGQAYAGELAAGISKALFHTLLGLVLAIPCLVVFGFYRTVVDRHCNRAMSVCAELVEALPPAPGEGAAR